MSQQNYKRWYDHDPVLLEVITLLQNYQEELKAQGFDQVEQISELIMEKGGIRKELN